MAAQQSPRVTSSPASDRKRQILKNTSKLKVTLTLDRQAYFPMEEALLQITIVNPESQDLEVYDPWHAPAARLFFLAELIERRPLDTDPLPTQIIPAHEESTRFFRLDGATCRQPGSVTQLNYKHCAMPSQPGKHVLQMVIAEVNGATTQFDVIDPGPPLEAVELEVDPYVRDSRDVFGRPTGKSYRTKAYARAYKLKRRDQENVCLVRGGVPVSLERAQKERISLFQSPMFCVHSSTRGIGPIKLERDSSGVLTLRFDEDRVEKQIRFDRQWKRLDSQ
jgi:hypothetical protein